MKEDEREREAMKEDERDWKPHHDDEGIDEVRIKLVPRFKTSGASGDEWRVSANVTIFYKGKAILETRYGSVSAAADELGRLLESLCERSEDEMTPYGRERLRAGLYSGSDPFCFQPGCSAEHKGAVIYQIITEYCDHGNPVGDHAPRYRAFCARHSERGDCGLEDQGRNYTKVSGLSPAELAAARDKADESPAKTIVVHADSIEDLPRKLDEVRKKLKRKHR